MIFEYKFFLTASQSQLNQCVKITIVLPRFMAVYRFCRQLPAYNIILIFRPSGSISEAILISLKVASLSLSHKPKFNSLVKSQGVPLFL